MDTYTAGHYYSQEAIRIKKLVFPKNHDATKMFWLINEDGAYGARAGLLYLMKEILSGIFKGAKEKNQGNNTSSVACDYNIQSPCTSTRSTINES